MLNDHLVEDALELVIDSQQIPITEEPTMVLVFSETRKIYDESTKVSTMNVTSVNSLRHIYSFKDTTILNNKTTKTNQKENTTSLPLSLRNSSLSDNNHVNKER